MKIENNKFCHAELLSASFKRAVFTFNPKNSGLDYWIGGYLDPETSSGWQGGESAQGGRGGVIPKCHSELVSESPWGIIDPETSSGWQGVIAHTFAFTLLAKFALRTKARFT